MFLKQKKILIRFPYCFSDSSERNKCAVYVVILFLVNQKLLYNVISKLDRGVYVCVCVYIYIYIYIYICIYIYIYIYIKRNNVNALK